MILRHSRPQGCNKLHKQNLKMEAIIIQSRISLVGRAMVGWRKHVECVPQSIFSGSQLLPEVSLLAFGVLSRRVMKGKALQMLLTLLPWGV